MLIQIKVLLQFLRTADAGKKEKRVTSAAMKMIYRKWSMMTMQDALVGVAGALALGGAFFFKDKAVAYVEQFRREGEFQSPQDRDRIAAERNI